MRGKVCSYTSVASAGTCGMPPVVKLAITPAGNRESVVRVRKPP